MKIYGFGRENAPAILLLPGTCCHWRSSFGHVIPLLAEHYRVLCVSCDGFDETEKTAVPTMLEETERIERSIQGNCGGRLRGACGCSLGGLLAARGNIRMDYGILGSSDLDQSGALAAKLRTKLLMPLFYPMVRDGAFSSAFLRRRVKKRLREMPYYAGAFLKMMGGARPYVSQESCRNQFYSDLVTPLPGGIDVPGTEFHIFYAGKMGEKYRERFLRHFAHPVIHRQDMQHEELLACHPEDWAALVSAILEGCGAAESGRAESRAPV